MSYDPPTKEQFIAEFPEFASTSPTLIDNALTQGGRNVDLTWIEADFALAIMLYAAHVIIFSQNAVDSGGSGGRIVSESLGRISMQYERIGTQFDENYLGTTSYGIEYTKLLRLNRAGPRIV